MKNLPFIDKLLFIANSIVAAISLVAFLSYFISPNTISLVSFVGLSIPFVLILNILFIVYWILRFKKQFLISTLVLLIGIQYVTKLYSFSEKKVFQPDDIKIMNYNVRMFNLYNWIDEANVDQKIYAFINEQQPDILCLQEFNPKANLGFNFPYKYIKRSQKNGQFGHAIFSKYKIIKSESLNFSNSGNNTIFADIVKGKDTFRVYNVHLESLKINPKNEHFNQEISEKLRIRLENSFKKQANQVELIIQHQKKINYKSIICGDFNNTAFSYVYKQLKRNKNDAFEIAGKGFGKTYDFEFPLRIDFILTDKEITVNNFKTFDVKYSDHYPIMARFNFNTN
ncbi:endonuclease/exonuclease/phosphatase family protein [Lutibacter sp.]|uniref:endonuclease/exonuclease/phosphatase family protein n=1 Tax=Lutibacter sp. TaxID=1925666 RepID=UPI003568C668